MSKQDAQSLYREGIDHQKAGAFRRAISCFTRALERDADLTDAAMQLGRCHDALSHWSFAVDAYRRVLALDENHIEAATAHAEALRQAGCYHRALTAYNRALSLKSDHLYALAGKGETLRMLGRAEEAVRWFENALQVHPEHAFALRGKAAALNALWRYNEALPYWEDALEIESGSTFALHGKDEAEKRLEAVDDGDYELGPPPAPPPLTGDRLAAEIDHAWGRALAADGRLTEAVGSFRRALRRMPEWVECAMDLALALEDAGDWDDALEAYDRILVLDPGRVAAACNRAETLRKAERFDEALVAYDDALKLEANYIYALAGRAETLRMLGRHEEALEWFDRALERKPTHAFALRGKGASLNALRRFEDARDVWRRAIDIDPGAEFAAAGLRHAEAELARRARQLDRETKRTAPNAQAWTDRDDTAQRARARGHFDMGRALLQQSRFQEAIAAFEQAVREDPDWTASWYLLGLSHDEDGQHHNAVKAFDEVLARDPQHVEAACQRGDALRRSNDFAGAMASYDLVIERQSDEVRALAGKAEALRMLGRFEEAIEWFDKVLELRANHYFALCGKAASLNALRRFEDALPLWERALEENANASFVRRGLDHARQALGDRGTVPQPNEAPDTTPVPDTPEVTSLAPPRVTSITRVRRAPPTSAREELERGRELSTARSYDQAVASFERALVLDPLLAEAALRLGMVYEDTKQFDRAIAAYERCLDIEADHYQAATNIGEAHRKDQSYEDAIVAYDRALAIRPDYLYALAGRAECMRMQHDYEGSLAWFDKAFQVGPRHAFAIQGKAAALNALHRFEEALLLWDKALEIEPESKFAADGKTYCEEQLRKDEIETEEDEEESETPTLDEQGRDLTALARSGKLSRIIGRRTEIRAVMKTLVRRLKANPLLLGEPGVGKTAVVEGVAQLLASEDAPERLQDVRIIELSMGSLVAGTKYRGTFEERLREIIKEASANPGIVLFIDEIHTLVGAGRTEGGSLDAANILKPALARGEINVIGATTMAEYRKHFESDSALERRFQPITIEEPSIDATVELLQKVQDQYANHHEVGIDPEALEACVRLAVRYIPDRRLPDKALDLLDESCAEASLSDEEERERQVTAPLVAQVVSERTGIPVRKLTDAERERIDNIEQFLTKEVVGQDEAVRQLANAVRLARSGLRDPNKPRGVFLFVGQSGVGKTELARALSEFLFPEGNALIKVDMSEYTEKFTGTRLIGAPPGYKGHGDEGQLTGPLRHRPYAVVLLDEFEKAHGDVQTMFLSLFDEGVINDSEGRKVQAKEAFFIMTTNAGSQITGGGRMGFGDEGAAANRDRAVEKIRPFFRPELLNRIDDIIVFEPLESDKLGDIVEMHLERLRDRAAEQGVRLSWDPEVVALCAGHKHDPAYGARPAVRAIDELVAEPLGQALLRADSSEPREFRASVEDGKVVFEVQPQVSQTRPKPEEEEPEAPV